MEYPTEFKSVQLRYVQHLKCAQMKSVLKGTAHPVLPATQINRHPVDRYP